MTDDRDRKVLMALMNDFYCEDLLKPNFKAFGLDDYEIPEGNLHYLRYVDSIQKMPLDEPPSLFGFHPNASITKQLNATDMLCQNLLRMGEIEGVKKKGSSKILSSTAEIAEESSEQKIEKICNSILSKLPHPFDIEAV